MTYAINAQIDQLHDRATRLDLQRKQAAGQVEFYLNEVAILSEAASINMARIHAERCAPARKVVSGSSNAYAHLCGIDKPAIGPRPQQKQVSTYAAEERKVPEFRRQEITTEVSQCQAEYLATVCAESLKKAVKSAKKDLTLNKYIKLSIYSDTMIAGWGTQGFDVAVSASSGRSYSNAFGLKTMLRSHMYPGILDVEDGVIDIYVDRRLNVLIFVTNAGKTRYHVPAMDAPQIAREAIQAGLYRPALPAQDAAAQAAD